MACTPSAWKESPKVRPPNEGVPIDIYCTANECIGTANGIVTARGGDRVDWYSVTAPCAERLEIALRWEIPRDNSELALSLWLADRRGRVTKTLRQQARERARLLDDCDDCDPDDSDVIDRRVLAGRHAHLTMEYGVPPGTHLIGVHARNKIGAGAYTLDVIEDASCSNGAADVIRTRPENLEAPRSKHALVSITTAGMARQNRDGVRANEPTVVLDASDPRIVVGARAMLVDERGRRVRHGELEVVSTWSPEGGSARFASARFVEPGWFRRKIELGWSYWFATLSGS